MILASGLTLLPKRGLGFRAGGYVAVGVAVVGALIAWTQEWGLPVLAVFLALGAVGVFLMQKGSSSFRKELNTRLAGKALFRKRWFVARFVIIGGLWVIGLIGCVLLLTLGGGWTVRPGGYAGVVLLLLGLLGAVAILVGSRGRPTMWMDADGHIYEQGHS